MLAFDFDYYLPDSVQEATDIYFMASRAGKQPYYYGGGTEIISMSRVYNLKPDVVIDIKNIRECQGFGTDGSRLTFGSAVSLKDISESGLFPLLALASGRIADHTIQVKITLGGNLAGTVYYHETLPPLMVCDSMITVACPGGGLKEVPIGDVLDVDKGLKPGELIVNVSLDQKFIGLPYAHIKKVQIEKIGYPLISASSIRKQDVIRIAVSGLCAYPVRLGDIPLGKGKTNELIEESFRSVTKPLLDDVSGSAKYREFILKKTIEKIIQNYIG